MPIFDLSERLLNFSIRSIKFLRTIPINQEYKIIRYQLIKSSTSSGANYEEAQAATTTPDFHNKVKISLREMRESNYWFKVLRGISNDIDEDELNWFLNESTELMKILGSIANKTKKQ